MWRIGTRSGRKRLDPQAPPAAPINKVVGHTMKAIKPILFIAVVSILFEEFVWRGGLNLRGKFFPSA